MREEEGGIKMSKRILSIFYFLVSASAVGLFGALPE
jgi:hypothetical protein